MTIIWLRSILLTTLLLPLLLCGQNCDTITLNSFNTAELSSYDSIFEADGLRDGPAYKDATLFFPTNGKTSLPTVIIVPGFGGNQSSFALWAPYLAKRGLICLTIGTNSIWDSPRKRAEALIDAMETIRQENKRVNSPVYQRIDTNNIVVAGWSMGGGGAQLAGAMEPRIKAIVAFTPWLDNSLTPADLNHQIPVLILSGEKDPTAPPAQHANIHYNYTPETTTKMLYELAGGNHSVALYPNNFGGDIGNITMAWLHTFVFKTSCYCPFLADSSINQNQSSTKYLTNINCGNLPNNMLTSGRSESFHLFPNPFSELITVTSNTLTPITYRIISIEGQLVQEGTMLAGESINTSRLAPGIYYFRSNSGVVKITKGW